jgi:hypothetical protein
MRTLIPMVFMVVASAAENPAVSPRDTDAVTRRRAEEALSAYAAEKAKPASTTDVGLLSRFAAAEATTLEGEGFLSKQQAVAAGERYLDAVKKMAAFAPEERQALGERWARLGNAVAALGRKLADSDALDKATAAAAVAAEPKPEAAE